MNLYDYIHEFDAYDSVMLCLESIQETVAYANYQQSESNRTSDMFTIFEGADPKTTQEKVSQNIFERFGKKIRELIEKLKEFGKWIVEKISSILPGMKSDSEKATQILKENPALRDQIIMSYEKGEMSLKDIANLEKDVSAVMKLYESGKIDEDTASGKIRAAADKFQEKAGKVLKVTGTVAGIIGLTTFVAKSVSDCRKNNDSFRKIIEDFHRAYENMAAQPGSKVGKVFSALSIALGFSTEETKNRVSFAAKLKNALKSFVHKNAGEVGPNAESLNKVKSQITSEKEKLKKDKNNEDIKKNISALNTIFSYLKRTGKKITDDQINKAVQAAINGNGPTQFFEDEAEDARKKKQQAEKDAQAQKRQKASEKTHEQRVNEEYERIAARKEAQEKWDADHPNESKNNGSKNKGGKK